MSNTKLKICIIPSGYPNEIDNIVGTFVEEHAKASAIYNDVIVFYPYFLPVLHSIRNIIGNNRKQFNSIREGNPKLLRLRIPHFNIAIRGISSVVSIFFQLVYLCISILVFIRLNKSFKPDIIHCHFTYPAGLLGALACKIFKVPLVISEHAGPFVDLMPTLFHKILVKYSLKTASIVIPVSSCLTKQIECHFTLNNVKVIPNIVDTDIFYYKTCENKEIKTKIILFVALFCEIKGIPLLLEAISLMKGEGVEDFRLEVVGNHNDSLMNQYNEKVNVLGIREHVVFHGQKSKREVAEIMRNCCFLTLSSYAETFGCVIIEALSCGKPVLATRCGGPEELITNENGLLVAPGDVIALKDGLITMLENYSKFDSEKISREAKALYSKEKVGKRLSEIYMSII